MRRIIGLLLAIIFAIAPLLTFAQPAQADTIDIAVGTTYSSGYYTDDAFVLAGGGIYLGGGGYPQLTFGHQTISQSSGMRFLNITIPAGSTITSAYITFKSYGNNPNTVCNLIIYGEQGNNVATFSTDANYNARILTATSVNWLAVPAWTNNTSYNSADISSIIQELVNDYGGLSSANIALFVYDNGSTASAVRKPYSRDGGYAPSLHIEFTSIPVLTTAAVTGNGYTAPNYLGTFNGEITTTGGVNADYRGFVWDTSTHADPGNTSPELTAYSDNWTASGSFAAGTFNHAETSFAGATEYFVRSYAHNSVGWAYGGEVSFTTLSAPTITTQAASMVSVSTARLNATVTSDGGQLSDVRFAYDNVTRANFALYANTTAWVTDNYSTGNNPYVDITGLTGATTYYFRVQIRNDVASAEGSELTFTTANGVLKPTNVSTIPSSTSMSVSWTKGNGALYTLARYKLGAYPTTTADGTSAYLGAGNSVSITSLTPGMTYYVSLWGLTGGTYSVDYATGLGTTLAYDAPGTGTGNAIEVPADTGTFTQTPSAVKVATVPFHEAVEAVSTAYGTPLNMVWYAIWMIAGLAGGILLYNRAGQGGQASYNLPMTFGAEAIWFGIGAGIGLTMMWIVVLFLVVATGFTMFGNRH